MLRVRRRWYVLVEGRPGSDDEFDPLFVGGPYSFGEARVERTYLGEHAHVVNETGFRSR